MTPLELILIFILQFEGISGGIHLFYRPGAEAILPCHDVSSSDRVCSTVYWLYSRDLSQTFGLVKNGNVNKSARAARLSLDTNCSLVINNITAEDVGYYSCRQAQKLDIKVYLSIVTILPSPPDADPKTDGKVTLECSLLRFSGLTPCRQNSIRWVNETGTVLPGEGVTYEIIELMKCVSPLTVKRQSGHNRRYTCQVVDERNNVQIEVDYTPVFTCGINDDQTDKSNTDWSPLDYVMLTLRISGLLLITVIVVLLIKGRGNKTPPDQNNVHDDGDEVKYENVEATSAAT